MATVLVRKLMIALLWLIALGVAGWSLLVVQFSPAVDTSWRGPLAAGFGAIYLAAAVAPRYRTQLRSLALLCIAVVLALWASINPSNERDWQPEVARIPWAEVRGDEVTIHDVRNFRYRTEQDFDAVYETRTVNLNNLSGVDFAVSYWAGTDIAHIMVSFAFAEKDFLAFSIETRKERGESYSTVGGFFRNYELIYVVADERDLFGVRTSHRVPEEQVYLLRTRIPLVNGRKLFLQYVKSMNRLKERPTFYNTLTTNCTTQVVRLAQAVSARTRFSWKILLSGHVPEVLFERGTLYPDMTLEEIMQRGLINERSKAAGFSGDYSLRIREGVPKARPWELDELR